MVSAVFCSLLASLALLWAAQCSMLCGVHALLHGAADAGATAAGMGALVAVSIGIGGIPVAVRTALFGTALALTALHAWLRIPDAQGWVHLERAIRDAVPLDELVRAQLMPRCAAAGLRDAIYLCAALRHLSITWAWLAGGLAQLREQAAAARIEGGE